MDNKATSEFQRRNPWGGITLSPMIENVPQRNRYVAWGQCPQCLDCFGIEMDSLSLPTAACIRAALSACCGAHISKRRTGWVIFNEKYDLRIRDAKVKVSNGSAGWRIFHKTCDKPMRILSVQQKASVSPGMRMDDEVEDDGADWFGTQTRPESLWR